MSKNYCAQQVCLAYAFNLRILVRGCFLAETYALQWPCEGFTRRKFYTLLNALFVFRESERQKKQKPKGDSPKGIDLSPLFSFNLAC